MGAGEKAPVSALHVSTVMWGAGARPIHHPEKTLSPGEERVSRNLSPGSQRTLLWTFSPSTSPHPFYLFSESGTAGKLLMPTVSATKERFEFLLSNQRLPRGGERRGVDGSRGWD